MLKRNLPPTPQKFIVGLVVNEAPNGWNLLLVNGSIFSCDAVESGGNCLAAALSAGTYSDGVKAVMGQGFVPAATSHTRTVAYFAGPSPFSPWIIVAYPNDARRRSRVRPQRTPRPAGLPQVLYGFGVRKTGILSLPFETARAQAATFFIGMQLSQIG